MAGLARIHSGERGAGGKRHITDELRRAAFEKPTAAKSLAGAVIDNQIRKNRRTAAPDVNDAGMRRAHELGWPNTYTLTEGIRNR